MFSLTFSDQGTIMLAKEWMNDRLGSATDAAHAGIEAASEAVAQNLHDAHRALARRSAAGLDHARAFGGELQKSSYRLGRSTRNLVTERPVESVVIIGVVAFAIGWLWRRSRESQSETAVAARSPSRRRTSKA